MFSSYLSRKLKQVIILILNTGFLFDQLISFRPFSILWVTKHRFFNFKLNNRFYSNVVFNLYSEFAIDQKLVVQGFYDIKTQYLLTNFLREGDCFIDVGANIGAMTFTAASKVGTSGVVYAFEPGPIHYRMLTQTVANSKIKNVKLYNLGCSNSETNLFWKMDDSNPGNAQISKTSTDISVKVRKLDHVIPETQNVRLIKIDVEGMELEVLEGAERIIKQSKPLMIIETNTGDESEVLKTNQVLEYLQKLNYSFYAVKNAESELIALHDLKIRLMPVFMPDVPQNVLCIFEGSKDEFKHIL